MTQSNRSATSAGVLPGTRILCVDDESMIGELVAQILRSQLRCTVTTAKNGEEALVALEGQDFDLILVDYVMPNMDGGELYRTLEVEYPEVLPRLMFITGDILSETTLDYIAGTGRLLLEKPFGLPELTSAVRKMIGGNGTAPVSARARLADIS